MEQFFLLLLRGQRGKSTCSKPSEFPTSPGTALQPRRSPCQSTLLSIRFHLLLYESPRVLFLPCFGPLQKESHRRDSLQGLPRKWDKAEFGPTLTLLVSSSPLLFAGGIQASLYCSNLSIYHWQITEPKRLSAFKQK